MGSANEGYAVGVGASVQSTTKRSGAYAARCNGSASLANISYQKRAAGGGLGTPFHSIKVWWRYVSGSTTELVSFLDSGLTTFDHGLAIDSGGSMYAYVGSDTGANAYSLASLNDGLFHRLECDFGDHAGVGASIYLDGALILEITTTTPAAQPILVLGPQPAAARTCDMYFDDLVAFDASFGGALWSDWKVLSLPPVSDNTVGSGWVNGGLGSTNLYDALNNVPPIGKSNANKTATSQIQNGASVNSYDANIQDYTAGGVLSTDTIRAVQPMLNHSETGAAVKAGTFSVVSNPAVGGQTFDWADAVGAAGAFPAQWRSIFGTVVENPSITLGTQPVLRITKTTSSSQVAFADYAAINVLVSPAAAPPSGPGGRLSLLGAGR